jgi:hypothetical protein
VSRRETHPNDLGQLILSADPLELNLLIWLKHKQPQAHPCHLPALHLENQTPIPTLAPSLIPRMQPKMMCSRWTGPQPCLMTGIMPIVRPNTLFATEL